MNATPLPGTLVRVREREWVVLPSEEPELLLLRPLGGGDGEVTGIYLPLARAIGVDAFEGATFPPPRPEQAGDFVSGRLLRDAARLLFRSGAGPFRSLGRIAVRPRPFQIVPLLMALRLETVRMLIADDVGIGKTIEVALIARELLDRGEARRLAVLTPPHLCDQWARELSEKFNLDPVIVRSGTIAALERALPPGDISVFEHFKTLVISIDFAKSDRRRDSFLRGCPDLVIVDEAHTAARAGGGRATQQRHDLLRRVAEKRDRHLLLLTATPHSGVAEAFQSLLDLLDPVLGQMDMAKLSEGERKEIARHFVQRRRADVQHWLGEDTPFPQRESKEITYRLGSAPAYRKLFDDVYDFARELVLQDGGGMAIWKRRVRWWTALALLRCVMSSPAAAQATLQARIARTSGSSEEESARSGTFAQYVLDLTDQESASASEAAEVAVDFEPTSVVEEGDAQLDGGERRRLRDFLRRAGELRGEGDPKVEAAAAELADMLRAGYHPIVYCRYIATAEYLAPELLRRLKKEWPDLAVVAVTGKSSEDEREQRVAELASQPRRLLVATDCLSEGVNLQEHFSAVMHYDLPWNPNRLEQREGRVDRYGQPRPIVRTSLLYSVDNKIEARVLKVLVRKAREIRRDLGITVPLPVDSESVAEALVRGILEEEGTPVQLRMFDDQPPLQLEHLEEEWDRARDREKVSRTRFAQHAIKPEEVQQELEEAERALGNAATVASFVAEACHRLHVPLQPLRKGEDGKSAVWRLSLSALPVGVREQVEVAFAPAPGKPAPSEVRIVFDGSPPEGAVLVGRLHPLTEALAEHLLDEALDPGDGRPEASRSGAIRSVDVTRRTALLLLRLRLLIESSDTPAPLLAEEMIVAGYEGRPGNLTWLDNAAAMRLLEQAAPAPPAVAAPLAEDERQELLRQAIDEWWPEVEPDLANLVREREAALRDSHRRVRQATGGGRGNVKAILPTDLLGVYVLIPVPRGVAR